MLIKCHSEHHVGDIRDSEADIICHSVNCRGTVGAGIAATVKRRFPKAYATYLELCRTVPALKLLGNAQVVPINETEVHFIADVLSQDRYGADKQSVDYVALRSAFSNLKNWAVRYGKKSVAIPFRAEYGFGCGDWLAVSDIIDDVFADRKVKIEIWRAKERHF